MAIEKTAKHFQCKDLEAWKVTSAQALASARPVLTHLNADTTWLVQLPRPELERTDGRTVFNILIDPWLQGPQSDVAAWFSTQWHLVAPGVDNMAKLNAALAHLEGFETDDAEKSYIDAVLVSHEFTDHCHRATLEELPKSTPVFATDQAAILIRSWSHFDTVITTPGYTGGESWKKALGDAQGLLPSWVGIGRVITPGNALYYHSAVLIVFDLTSNVHDQAGEAIIYSPHGIKASDLECVKDSGLQTLALLHGLHDVQIWRTKQLNLGGLNGAEAVRACGAKYWIATHDEIKKGGGLVSYFLQRKVYTFKDAVPDSEGNKVEFEFAELDSGDGLLLE